jgi:hypothetical protein
MRRFWLIPIVFVVLFIPVVVLAGSGDGDGSFDDVVHSIEARYHVQATRIPFPGIVSLVAHKATQDGVRGMHLAEFESFSEPVDGDELNRLVAEKLGSGWEQVIRETKRKPESPATGSSPSGNKGDEQTLIFMRPEGERMGLFIVDKEGSEMDVVEVSVDPEHLDGNLRNLRHHQGDRDGDKSD